MAQSSQEPHEALGHQLDPALLAYLGDRASNMLVPLTLSDSIIGEAAIGFPLDKIHQKAGSENIADLVVWITRQPPEKDPAKTFADGRLTVDLASREVRVNKSEVELRAREFDILLFLAENRRLVLSHSQIYEHVWPAAATSGLSTVTSTVGTLRTKLGPLHWVIQTRLKAGYMFDDSPDKDPANRPQKD